MNETDLIHSVKVTIDLKDGLVRKAMIGQLMKGDKKANRVIVAIEDGKEKADLSNIEITGSFIRPPDGAEVPLTGTKNDNEAIVLLEDACYENEGYCEINVKLTIGGTMRTVLNLTGNVLSKGSGAYIDVNNVIPSLDDIIIQYSKMKQVTEEAQSATEEAKAATEKAKGAAEKIDGMTVSAKSASAPDAHVSEINGVKHIEFDLVTPDISFEVHTGLPGTDVQISASGTPEKPHLSLTIPRGNTGSLDNMPFFNADPQALGEEANSGTSEYVSRGDHVHPRPTAEQIGALPADGTAQNADKLGGKTFEDMMLLIYPVGSIYISVNSTNPGTLFGGSWTQLKDRFLLGAGNKYTAGKTGGLATVELTINQMPEHRHAMRETSSSPSTEFDSYIATSDDNNDAGSASSEGVRRYTTYVGGSEPHENMPPYLSVYMWKRVE